MADEIAGPLGTDLQIGAGPADDHRIAELIPPPPLKYPDVAGCTGHLAFTGLAVAETPTRCPGDAQTSAAPTAIDGPRARPNVVGDCARGASAIRRRNGTDPVAGDDRADLRGAKPWVDLVLGVPLRFGIGFALPKPRRCPGIPDGRICYWGGYGGSQTVMVPEAKTTISYVMNKMGGELLGSARTSAYLDCGFCRAKRVRALRDPVPSQAPIASAGGAEPVVDDSQNRGDGRQVGVGGGRRNRFDGKRRAAGRPRTRGSRAMLSSASGVACRRTDRLSAGSAARPSPWRPTTSAPHSDCSAAARWLRRRRGRRAGGPVNPPHYRGFRSGQLHQSRRYRRARSAPNRVRSAGSVRRFSEGCVTIACRIHSSYHIITI